MTPLDRYWPNAIRNGLQRRRLVVRHTGAPRAFAPLGVPPRAQRCARFMGGPEGIADAKKVGYLAVQVEDHPLEYGKFADASRITSTVPARSRSGTADLRVRQVERGQCQGLAARNEGGGPLRPVPDQRRRLDDPPHHPAPEGWEPLPDLVRPMLATTAVSSLATTTSGPTSSSGTVYVPSSTPKAAGSARCRGPAVM